MADGASPGRAGGLARALSLGAAVMWLAAAGMATPAAAGCRLALAIGLDRSGSVDPDETRLMVEGMASALEDEGVRAAFLALPGSPAELAIFEWSGERYQRLVLDWTQVGTEGDLDRIALRLRTQSPVEPPTETAVGSALLYGAAKLAERPGCRRLTLDLAGDGKSNAGPPPETLDFAPAGRTATLNALVIGLPEGRGADPGIAELTAYFRARVIRGPGAFVEAALGYGDFSRAMSRKLRRELEIVVGEGPAGRGGGLRLAAGAGPGEGR
ncbi:MAG: DUF1194 domain-containing protein [Paracoccaceae bacterium]